MYFCKLQQLINGQNVNVKMICNCILIYITTPKEGQMHEHCTNRHKNVQYAILHAHIIILKNPNLNVRIYAQSFIKTKETCLTSLCSQQILHSHIGLERL